MVTIYIYIYIYIYIHTLYIYIYQDMFTIHFVITSVLYRMFYHVYIYIYYGYGSKPCTPGEPQNRW